MNYKETEIGLLPESWEVVRLGYDSIFNFENGLWTGKKLPLIDMFVLRNTNFNNDGTLSFQNVAKLKVEENKFQKRQLIYGDIILERSGGGPKQPVGRVAFFNKKEEKYSFSNFTSRIRVIDNGKCISKYLLYFLLYYYYLGNTNAMQNATTGIRNLDFAKYKLINIPLPPLPEQQKIAYVLSAVQEAGEKTENVINSLKELKKSTMKHLFTYGAISFEDAEKVKLKDTEIGKVLESWDVVKLGDVVLKTEQKDMRKTNIEFKYIDVSSINKEISRISDFSWFNGENAPSRARKIVKTNDVIMATVRPTLKRLAIINEEYDNQICSTAFCVLKSNKEKMHPKFLYYFIQRDIFIEELEKIQKGANYPAVTDYEIKKQKIMLPPFPEQQQIASILSAVDEKIEAEENKKKALDELFKSMLHNLMTAKLRVNELEIPV